MSYAVNRMIRTVGSRIYAWTHPPVVTHASSGWTAGDGPRVLFVSGTPGAPMRYRVLNQIEQLDLRHIATAYGNDDDYQLLDLVHHCDVLYLYRARDTGVVQQLLKIARRRSVPVLYDTDDLIWDQRLVEYCALEEKHGAAAAADFRRFFERTEALMQHVDGFVASTDYLGQALAEHFQKPVYVNPNAVSQEAVALSWPHYERRMRAVATERVTIGYFSGWPKTHEEDFAVALPAIIRILTDLPQTRLRIAGHLDIESWPASIREQIEMVPFVPWNELFESIASVDINLAPIIDNPHRRSKSAVKLLESALAGVPTVASDLDPYESIVHGQTGFLATTTDEWYTILRELTLDATLRRKVGIAAHDHVLATETTAARADSFVSLVRDIAMGKVSIQSQDSRTNGIARPSFHLSEPYKDQSVMTDSDTPLVSIIIRARDEEPSLRRLLPLLQSQRTDFPFEILLLDNDSQDGTAALAKEYNLVYHLIPRNKFNYSAALNTGAELSHGEIVINLSAHCFPQGDYWLAYLVEPMRHNPRVIATYGRQWTNPWTNPFESLGNDSMFPPPGQEPALVAFSNANCAVRRSFVLHHPFNPAIKILEDHLFYMELSSEYDFVYVPEALVDHEHDEFSWRYYIRRWLREGWAYFFLVEHRGLKSPFVNRPFLRFKNILYYYPRLARWFYRHGRRRVGGLTMPFFILRDSLWVVGFRWAQLKHARMAQEDTALLLKMQQQNIRQIADQQQIQHIL